MKALRLLVEVFVPDYCDDDRVVDDETLLEEVKTSFRDRGILDFLDWDSDCYLLSAEVIA